MKEKKLADLKEKFSIQSYKKRVNRIITWSTAMVLLVALVITFTLGVLCIRSGLIDQATMQDYWVLLIAGVVIMSITISGVLSYFINKNILKPINNLIDGFEKLSNGKYDTRLTLGSIEDLKKVEDAFNGLAKELQNTEILRSDFINNFSHEFKTPIVSIKGLISLLRTKELSPQKREEYLSVIEDETNRLSVMTTNILNLTKLENQDILAEKNSFNLSEQIRTCALLLEKNWTEKNIELFLDFEDYNITANEDMLKQVWVNLIDNAIKFSPNDSLVKIKIEQTPARYLIVIENEGELISEEDREKIFHKFYQINKTGGHGNGIGLSVVRRIITLHGGDVFVKNNQNLVVFTVSIPKK